MIQPIVFLIHNFSIVDFTATRAFRFHFQSAYFQEKLQDQLKNNVKILNATTWRNYRISSRIYEIPIALAFKILGLLIHIVFNRKLNVHLDYLVFNFSFLFTKYTKYSLFSCYSSSCFGYFEVSIEPKFSQQKAKIRQRP